MASCVDVVVVVVVEARKGEGDVVASPFFDLVDEAGVPAIEDDDALRGGGEANVSVPGSAAAALALREGRCVAALDIFREVASTVTFFVGFQRACWRGFSRWLGLWSV